MKKYLCILIGLIAFNLNAQKKIIDNDVKAVFNVYLDNKKIETDSVCVGFVATNEVNQYAMLNDSFTTWLKADKTYHMVITHPNYNKQMLRIVTSKNNSTIKIDVKLQSNAPDCYIGYYKYSKLLNKYIEYN